MSTGETRPLLYRRQSRFSRQPSPERVGGRDGSQGGQTSHLRTVVNLVNLLAGVGLLSLPLAFRYTGWILGFALLVAAAGITAHAARRLTRCMEQHAELQSYLDIAGAACGDKVQLLTTILFSLTIIAAGVACAILFGDTMNLLVPSISSTLWKIVIGVIVLPTQFFSLRLMAPLSIIGLFSCVSLVGVVVILGLVKETTPGSLLQPAKTTLVPGGPLELTASLGLFLAPWGATASIPSFYRDIKTPKTYNKGIMDAFSISLALSAIMATTGYLMFGNDAAQEIISNILSISAEGYPHAVISWLIALTALIPVTKVTLR